MMEQIVTVSRRDFIIVIYRNLKLARSSAYYRVELVDGKWPSDSRLITICDNITIIKQFGDGDDGPVRHFGGYCRELEDGTKSVCVYID